MSDDEPRDRQDDVLAVVISAAGAVELRHGPAFDAEQSDHSDLAADVTAAVRGVLDAHAAVDPSGGRGA